MAKQFNTTGICIPERNYMVDVSSKMDAIVQDYIDKGKYFTISRARQYGKTTILYLVSLYTFATGLVRKISRILKAQGIAQLFLDEWIQLVSEQFPFDDLSGRITALCRHSDKPAILMIDEVDKSSDNQVFLSFLGLLRNKYLEQMQKNDDTFQSVALAGVYDIKNLKSRLRPDEEKKYNSPWNIAVDFEVDMSFAPVEIAGMLRAYEGDHHTGMDIEGVSRLIYDYTSGYPYLVSRLCQLADERLAGTEAFPEKRNVWTQEGIVAAELMLRRQSNTLFDDLIKKLTDYPKLKKMVQEDLGVTFGFFKEKNATVAIGNRIFETKLYDLFLSEMLLEDMLVE